MVTSSRTKRSSSTITMRSATWDPRRSERESHRENGAAARPAARRGDVPTHATRELPRDGQTQAGAVGDALTVGVVWPATAVMQIEQTLGHMRFEAPTFIADVEPPAAVAH